MAKLLGIDTGGTYTDAVLYDETSGVTASAKALTTKHDLVIGVAEAMAQGLGGEAGRGAHLLGLPLHHFGHQCHCRRAGRSGLPAAHRLRPRCLRTGRPGGRTGQRPGGLHRRWAHSPTGEEQAPLDLAAVRAAVEDAGPQGLGLCRCGLFRCAQPASRDRRARPAARDQRPAGHLRP